MQRRSFIYSSAALVGAGMLSPGDTHAKVNHSHCHTVSLMTAGANHLLAALDADQRDKISFPFDADERMNWHFIPRERKGLPLREMLPYQKHLASALLAAGLSQTGYIKAVTIMSLEEVLGIMENDNGERRNAEKYFFSIFGTPADSATWGYRVEGHHLSQNYTVANGKVVDGPSFFGSNPAEVRQGPRQGLRVLAGEDDFGFQLLHSLDERQQKVAIVQSTAYGDILTFANRQAALEGQPSGLHAARMNSRQFDALRELMEEYANNVSGELAETRLEQIEKAAKNIHFAWAGGVNPGDRHYYRIQADSFLIELDETQDNANHIHSVWRDFNGDFGLDLLQQHYHESH